MVDYLTKPICRAPNCERPAQSRGYCPKHYGQIWRHGRLTPELERQPPSKRGRNPLICSVEACSGKPIAKGYCWRHYQQIRRHGRLTPEREKHRSSRKA